ncbi:MAG: hypothetical protein LWX83_08900 [Anaerolineae bacterium]|nr:hypothetical protein [Anaerolineae bacterium]
MQKRWSIIFALTTLALSQIMCSLINTVGDRLENEVSKTLTVISSTLEAAQKEFPTLQSQMEKTVAAAQTNAPDMEELQKTLRAVQTEVNSPPEVSSESTAGSISGKLSYPSEFIPPLTVVAFELKNNQMSGKTYQQNTETNQMSYQLNDLPPGEYYMVAYVQDPKNTLAAGYTEASLCGLTADCEDHSLVKVQVKNGENTGNIDLMDWYAPEGTYPNKP